jgi:hyperosmotically inducible periplasmic protein
MSHDAVAPLHGASRTRTAAARVLSSPLKFSKEKAMKLSNLILAVGTSVIMTSVGSAYAQTSDAAVSVDASSAATPTKKQIRTQNRALERTVRKTLSKVKGLTSSDVTILVKGGVITLAGSVPDESEIELAGNAAKSVTGVTSVQNRLSVREPGN